MAAGRRNTYVTLSEIENDNTPTAFDPAGIWVAYQPAPPSFDEAGATSTVEADWHPQMTTNTILTLDDGTQLFVKGFQDVDNRHITHMLFCEEVKTP